MRVSFEVSSADYAVIQEISKRAYALGFSEVFDVSMDVTAAHANGCPLRLAELLAADDFNFLHDVAGIARHIDRDTGKIAKIFLPRNAA